MSISGVPIWFEIVSFVVLGLILLFDLLLVIKRPHVPSAKEATGWIVFYVGLALVFTACLFFVTDGNHHAAGEFFTGWLTEYSLSVDNLFVFLLLMARFKVPRPQQQFVLMAGIIMALVLRGIFILLGAWVIEQFTWVFYIFGAFLLITAFRQAFASEDDEDEGENALIRFFRKHLRMTQDFHGDHLFVREAGRRVMTPMMLVLIAFGTTDLLFAVDSIPAIFGITLDPFIVFTANIFALMGLRQLYFLLGAMLDRLRYLHYGIAFILAFIGVKLVLHALHENEVPFINNGQHIAVPEIETWHSLVVIVASMGIAIIASLAKDAHERRTGTAKPATDEPALETATEAEAERSGRPANGR